MFGARTVKGPGPSSTLTRFAATRAVASVESCKDDGARVRSESRQSRPFFLKQTHRGHGLDELDEVGLRLGRAGRDPRVVRRLDVVGDQDGVDDVDDPVLGLHVRSQHGRVAVHEHCKCGCASVMMERGA